MINKIVFIFSALLTYTTVNGQISNGNFEDGLNSDLSNWEWSCFAEPDSSTPPGGGNWSIKVWGGNTQGCFPGHAYQTIPSITNGQTIQLTGWAFAQAFPPVGLYLGKINSGVITIIAGDTTSSTTWTQNFSQITPTAWTEDSSSGYENNLESYKSSSNGLSALIIGVF